MKTYTIKEALLDESAITPGWVYVVRDGSFIFYVGMSRDPTFRLCQHVGIADSRQYSCSPEKLVQKMEAGEEDGAFLLWASGVGRCIRENAPESLAWSFDIYENQDAIDALKQTGAVLPHVLLLMEQSWFDQRTIVESVLINKLNPCFNRMLNHQPTPLPDHYRQSRLEAGATDSLY